MAKIAAASRHVISQKTTLWIVGLLWLAYVILQTCFVMGLIAESWSAVLGFGPGVIGIVVLLSAGMSKQDLFLSFAPLSVKGFLVLSLIFIFALSAIIPFGEWQGWNWKAALIFAPASGISQEIFFRAVLLPSLLMTLNGRSRPAIILHALMFSLWHIGPFFVGAPLWAGLAVMTVPFISGLGWGWEVKHDGSVLWAALQHSLVWVIAGQFPMG